MERLHRREAVVRDTSKRSNCSFVAGRSAGAGTANQVARHFLSFPISSLFFIVLSSIDGESEGMGRQEVTTVQRAFVYAALPEGWGWLCGGRGGFASFEIRGRGGTQGMNRDTLLVIVCPFFSLS